MVYRLKLCAPRNRRHEITKYQIEFIDRICIKGHEFLFFAKTMDKAKTLSMLRGLLTPQKNSATDAFKTASINVIQKKQKQMMI